MTNQRVPEVTAATSPPGQSLDYDQIKSNRELIGGGGQGVVYRVELPQQASLNQLAVKEPVRNADTLNTWQSLCRRRDHWR